MSDDKGLGIKSWIAGQKPKVNPVEAKLEPVVLDKHRIAVLPLANMSPDPQDEYFSDGMTEELISAISKVPGLRVISRTSVMQYKNQAKQAVSIGRELNVGTLLEGSVRKAGNRLRITVQLIDSSTDDHLWAENYDRNLDDIFAIQSEVASRVAGSLFTKVFTGTQWKDTDNVEAYTLYLRAMQLFHEGTEHNVREAIELFNRAILRDPTFARAYAGLALAWENLAETGYEEFTPTVRRAETLAHKALETGPNCAEAHATLSIVHRALDRYPEAISEAEKALAINPSLSEAYLSRGTLHAVLGDLERGLQDFRRAYELDPLSYPAACLATHWLMLAGREDEAFGILERIKERNPKNPEVYAYLTEAYFLKKDFSLAEKMIDTGLGINPRDPWLLLLQGMIYAHTNRREEAEKRLRLLQDAENESTRLNGELYIQSSLGNLDQAFRALMRMVETHSWPSDIKFQPGFAEMRRDSRFAEFCKKVGIPP